MEYNVGDGMSLPAAYSEFGLAADSGSMSFPSRLSDFGLLSKTLKSPPEYDNMSFPLENSNFGVVQLVPKGSKANKTEFPKGTEAKKASSDYDIIKNASKNEVSSAAAKKTTRNGGKGDDDSKSNAPPIARSFTPIESTTSDASGELTEADFAASKNMESNAPETVSIGVLTFAVSFLFGGALMV